MGRRSRSVAVLEREREQVLELHVGGLSQVQIAERLGLHKSTISRVLSIHAMAWRVAIAAELGTEGRELAQVRNMLRSTWAAWRASGDAAYLGIIHWCLDREADLLGLSVSPVWLLKQEVTLAVEQAGLDPDGGL